MKKLFALAALFTALSLSPAAHAEKKVVAVLPFSSPNAYSAMGKNAQETFVTQLVKTRKLRVIQASMVARMLRRRGLHYTGTVDPPLLKAAGRWLKADYLLAGKLRWAGDAYVLSAHVADVNTLETTMAEDIDFRDDSKMRVAVRSLARKVAGVISGSGSAGSKADLFLNVSPRAFYDTSDACIRAMGSIVNRFRFAGSVEASDEESKTIKVKGYARRLKKGVPLDIFNVSGIDGDEKVTTAYVTRLTGDGLEARYRLVAEDGVPLGGKVTNEGHRWIVAVGKIEDEAEDNKQLVERFRNALLEKMSEGDTFQQIEGDTTDMLAKLSNRRARFRTFRQLFARGVELVIEGKFYGASGSRRAHFKIYSTLTGKVWGEPKFETSL